MSDIDLENRQLHLHGVYSYSHDEVVKSRQEQKLDSGWEEIRHVHWERRQYCMILTKSLTRDARRICRGWAGFYHRVHHEKGENHLGIGIMP